jgi:hypothetical protein
MRIHPRQLPALFTQAKAWTSAPKVMIRADDLDTLQNLQRKIDHAFGTKSVLVHDRAKGSRQYPHRFQSVRRAMRECSNAQFWLHQYKLMEGVDNPDFIAVPSTIFTRTADSSSSRLDEWCERARVACANKKHGF